MYILKHEESNRFHKHHPTRLKREFTFENLEGPGDIVVYDSIDQVLFNLNVIFGYDYFYSLDVLKPSVEYKIFKRSNVDKNRVYETGLILVTSGKLERFVKANELLKFYFELG